ncbi:MAG: glycosyltransferase family A protein [bacterium]|nr:glycosyltransferase family A protein [bacterium]
MFRQKPLSVIIPSRNQSHALKLCLEAFQKQTVLPREILVIDNNSNDSTKDLVYSFTKKLPVRYFLEKGPGPSFARNRGISESKGEILAFIDSDCLPANNWVENIYQAYKITQESIIQGAWVNVLSNQSLPSTFYFLTLEIYRTSLLARPSTKSVSFIDTKNFFVPKKILLKEKLLFDQTLPIYAEDVDFGLQAIHKNIPIVYDPEIKVRHLAEKGWHGFFRSSFGVGKAKKLLEKKWKLEEKREKKLDDTYLRSWVKQRNYFISLKQDEIVKSISLEKNILFPFLLKSGLKLGKLACWLGQQSG